MKDRGAIDFALARRRPSLVCQYCDPKKRPGVIVLLDVLEKQFAAKTGEEQASELGRKANESISDASKEQVMVGEVMSIVAAADQICEYE